VKKLLARAITMLFLVAGLTSPRSVRYEAPHPARVDVPRPDWRAYGGKNADYRRVGDDYHRRRSCLLHYGQRIVGFFYCFFYYRRRVLCRW